MLVHEIAEEFQLQHESQGEGIKRHIVLSKMTGKTSYLLTAAGCTRRGFYTHTHTPKIGAEKSYQSVIKMPIISN